MEYFLTGDCQRPLYHGDTTKGDVDRGEPVGKEIAYLGNGV